MKTTTGVHFTVKTWRGQLLDVIVYDDILRKIVGREDFAEKKLLLKAAPFA